MRLARLPPQPYPNLADRYIWLVSQPIHKQILLRIQLPQYLKRTGIQRHRPKSYALAIAGTDGVDNWTKAQRRKFANDFENLLVVDDSTNQSKSDQAPHEWLPPLKDYWCEYGKRWEQIKVKYGLRYSSDERLAVKGYLNPEARLMHPITIAVMLLNR